MRDRRTAECGGRPLRAGWKVGRRGSRARQRGCVQARAWRPCVARTLAVGLVLPLPTLCRRTAKMARVISIDSVNRGLVLGGAGESVIADFCGAWLALRLRNPTVWKSGPVGPRPSRSFAAVGREVVVPLTTSAPKTPPVPPTLRRRAVRRSARRPIDTQPPHCCWRFNLGNAQGRDWRATHVQRAGDPAAWPQGAPAE